MKRRISWLLAIAFSIILNQTTFAAKSSNDSSSHSFCSSLCTCGNNFLNKLNLNPEQQAKIKAIRDKFETTRVAKEKDLLGIHNQIEAIVNVDNLDEAKLDTLLNQKKNIMGILIKNRIMERHEVYNTLTPTQKVKYNQMVSDWEKSRLKKLNSASTTAKA